MDITILLDDEKNIIIDSFGRQCSNCKIRMEPLSTKCTHCGQSTPFKRVDEGNYAEHFEVKTCENHGVSFHYCMHPKSTSSLEELKVF